MQNWKLQGWQEKDRREIVCFITWSKEQLLECMPITLPAYLH